MNRLAEFLGLLGRGGKYGYLWTVDSSGKKHTYPYEHGRALPTPPLDHDVYFGVHPLSRLIGKYERGDKEEDIAALACVYAEFDGKMFVPVDGIDLFPYKEQLQASSKNEIAPSILEFRAKKAYQEDVFYADRAPWLKMAVDTIKALPIQPSIVIGSGGGYHCYWLLEEPFIITDEASRERAKLFQYDWVAFVKADPSSKDLKRILRVPGTWNYKARYGEPQPVGFCVYKPEVRYNFERLEAISVNIAIDVAPTKAHEKKPIDLAKISRKTIVSPQQVIADAYEFTMAVINAFNGAYSPEDILSRNGYEEVAHSRRGGQVRFNRPGGTTKGVVVFDTGRTYHFSDNDSLFYGNYSGTGAHDAYSLFVELECGGDTRMAREKAAREFNIVRQAPKIDLRDPVTAEGFVNEAHVYFGY